MWAKILVGCLAACGGAVSDDAPRDDSGVSTDRAVPGGENGAGPGPGGDASDTATKKTTTTEGTERACDAVANDCPDGYTCTIVSTGRTECRPEGPIARGGSCSKHACARGSVCVNAGEGPVCYQACRQGTECDTGECSDDLPYFDFGICR